jgi:hypothetical protein
MRLFQDEKTLRLKSELLRNHNLRPKGGLRLWHSCTRDSQTVRPKNNPHDREVLTKYVGEIVQHDSPYHLWSPPAREKRCLITSLDDFSRFILYATLVKKETSWTHILALQTVVLRHRAPFLSYVDPNSIFRFVHGRGSLWRKHHALTDEADPQWKQVMDDCNIKVTYALSPQARGKIDLSYGWLHDRVVRTVDSCRKTSLHNLKLEVNNATPRKRVILCIYPLNKDVFEVRFWCEDTLIDVQRIKDNDLKGVHF